MAPFFGWVGAGAVAKGLGKGAAADSGDATKLPAAHADRGLLLGYGAVGLGKKDGDGGSGGEADMCPALG